MKPRIFGKVMRRIGEGCWVMQFGRGKTATRCEIRVLSEDERQGTAYRFCGYVNDFKHGGMVARWDDLAKVCAWAERQLRVRGFTGAPS